MNVKFHKVTSNMKFQEFHLSNHSSFEIWHSFCRTPMRNFLWCYYRWLITSLAFEKYEKECNILKIILVQGFFLWKLKLLNFLVDSVDLNTWCHFPYRWFTGTPRVASIICNRSFMFLASIWTSNRLKDFKSK